MWVLRWVRWMTWAFFVAEAVGEVVALVVGVVVVVGGFAHLPAAGLR